ncbi:uncharacterized protein [Dysidea avara]|uniref:uncharacterized protein isoform X2 n=1 Tax=Dysidea avara TaxID=196820 RepID=UPI00332FD957
MAVDPRSRETRQRLEKCWALELDWSLFPELKEGCFQIGKALCIPPISVLGGLVSLTSFMISPAIVQVPGTEWSERVLVWESINMPTGSTKSGLYHYLLNLLQCTRKKCNCSARDPVWLLGDSTCEKMGDLMASNNNRLLGLYDELSTFLSQLNLYRGKNIQLSHELALFLQLYNGRSWARNTGDANFTMESTSLTVGGFSQPSIARSVIEQCGSAEIGLAQRFLWLFPQPVYSRFETLQPVKKEFTESLIEVLHKVWIPGKTGIPKDRVFTIKEKSEVFVAYFDEVQEQLEALACMDDLLSGMLSKSKGQVLRVAAVLHVLSYIKVQNDDSAVETQQSDEIASVISESAIKAAVNFVSLCCQQTAYMTGRGNIKEEVEMLKTSLQDSSLLDCSSSGAELNTPGYCLKLPGKQLNLSALLYAKKFRAYGYKSGAVDAFKELEAEGLGVLEEVKAKAKTVNYIFVKETIPEDSEGKIELSAKLQKYKVSLREYREAMEANELQPPRFKKKKRNADDDDNNECPSTPRRKSPRKVSC